MEKADMKILAAGSECKGDVVKGLKNLGYKEIIETEDGVSAWDFLKSNEVELIFADWALGQFDGLVLLKLMIADKKLCDIPVVLMCSKINREMVLDAGNAGVSAILVKPFNAKNIRSKIATLFEVIYDREKDTEAETLMEAGKSLVEEGKYEKALENFNKIIELYENPEVYYNIGYVKAAQQKYDESIIAFRKAINIDKKYAEAFGALGEVYLKIGLNDKAEQMMQRAGEIYMEKNMSKEAEIAFQEVLKLNPNTTNIYNSLGILYRRNKDYTKAIGAYEKAMRVSPEDENIFFNLGRACFETGLMKRAKLYLQRAVEIYPDFEQAKDILEKAEKNLEKG